MISAPNIQYLPGPAFICIKQTAERNCTVTLLRLLHDLPTIGGPSQLILLLMEHCRGTNVWGVGSVKHAGVRVYPLATTGMQPPGKADIPQRRALQLPGYKNTASHDMQLIPVQERQKSSGKTQQHTFKVQL